jgi:surface protein
MARTDTLGHFLTDVADAIREKTGESGTIQASSFDTAIANISSGSSNELTLHQENTYSVNWGEMVIDDTITSLSSLFDGISRFTTLPNLSFNDNITILESAYANCTKLTSVDLSNWDITNVTNMATAFNNCSVLTTINISSKITGTKTMNIANMFRSCPRLVNLDLSNLDIIANVIQYAFRDCTNLETVDFRNLKLSSTASFNNIAGMFYNCTKLSHIDIRSMDIVNNNVTASNVMLYNVPTTCEIIVKDDANKTWFNTNYSSYTNVKTVAEYES